MTRMQRVLLSATVAFALASACGQPAARREMSDAAVSQDVTNRLERDVELGSFDLQVTAKDGIVTLIGTVDDEQQRNDAARIAHEAAGVKQVVNRVVAERGAGSAMDEEAS